MAAGYRSGGVDFDDLFDPDVMGDGPSAAGLRSGGVPLKYAARAYGAKRADVGYRQGGTDVSNLWAAKGTAQYVIPGLDGKVLSAIDQAFTAQQDVFAEVSVTLTAAGAWQVAGQTSQGSASQPAPTSGTWLPSGQSGADYDVRFRLTDSGHSSRVVTNGASAYTRMNGAPVTASLSLSASGQFQPQRSASMGIAIDVRNRATGHVTTTTLSGGVTVAAFQ